MCARPPSCCNMSPQHTGPHTPPDAKMAMIFDLYCSQAPPGLPNLKCLHLQADGWHLQDSPLCRMPSPALTGTTRGLAARSNGWHLAWLSSCCSTLPWHTWPQASVGAGNHTNSTVHCNQPPPVLRSTSLAAWPLEAQRDMPRMGSQHLQSIATGHKALGSYWC